jgi:hypothetical protein
MRQLPAVALISLVFAYGALAAPKHTVRRGATFSIETQFNAEVKVGAASMTWQTFDALSAEQRRMSTTFRCDADIVATATGFALSCKVPLDAADGHYHLTALVLRAGDSVRKYGWQGDLPAEVEIQIKGGEEVTVPGISSMQVK